VVLFLNTVHGKKSFLSKESDTKLLQRIYFAYEVGIISSYSNKIFFFLKKDLTQFRNFYRF